jgi:hypothetical protein
VEGNGSGFEPKADFNFFFLLIAGEILNMKMQKDFQNVLQLTFNDLKTI